jgi:FMN-dependent oxidoreductase (nitrilotriacetate monooxygenase family)
LATPHVLLNAFEMNAVGHLAHGVWSHPEDRATGYRRIGYWMELARILERGLFDGLFLADVTGVYDVHGGGAATAIERAVQLPVNDPAVLVPAMAAVTRHLGFGITADVSAEPPHLFARRMSTLDHLSDGRVAWNIVTGFLDSAARATGAAGTLPHDDRYDRADDFMQVAYKLWEASWDDDAVIRDRATRRYADPAKVRAVRHDGPYFRLDAIHLAEPSPQRTPVLFQAGASARGLDFAAAHAECIFIPADGGPGTRAIVQRIEDRLAAAGRDRSAVKIFGSLQTVIGRRRAEAVEKYHDYAAHAVPEAALAQLSAATGIDFGSLDPDAPIPIPPGGGNAIRSILAGLGGAGEGPPTVRRLLAGLALGGRFRPLIGSAGEVAEEIGRRVAESGIDGFNLVRTVAPGSFIDVADLLVPELQARGLYKTSYAEGTLREKLFGRGPRLGAGHPAAAVRTGQDRGAPGRGGANDGAA